MKSGVDAMPLFLLDHLLSRYLKDDILLKSKIYCTNKSLEHSFRSDTNIFHSNAINGLGKNVSFHKIQNQVFGEILSSISLGA